ncbi:BppU family phage baseplate upper protein [Listeria seeligeri]|uniref:BppU family phage baseplate upper protein n=1 Tax=Listeria seeligeri TaxID=1640 RepID=UPI0016251055|nr:BppU family phage baseplate upper protein [Listeria seeligeri]MBC1480607.1 BppU family phage baseplate upper protein [Listeria seeligeri]
MTETENVIHKNGIYDFNVTTEEDKPLQKAVFYTQDTGGTARLIFNIDKDNQDLGLSSAAELELAMILAKGKEYESKYLVKPKVVDGVEGIAEYTLTDSQIAHDGNAIAELYIKYKNSQAMRVYKFSFEIKKALIDSDFFPVAEFYVERWDDYEKIFDESVAELSNKLEALDVRADNIQTQFDSFNPSQFTPKVDFENHIYNSDIHVTIANKIAWESKETVEGSQAKADKALDDAKTNASAKAAQALVDSKAYTDSKITQTVWTGSFYMSASQAVTPSIPLSQCKAWIIYWSKYSAGVARDYYWCTQVVTKETYGGHNFDAMMDNSPVHKYLYVSATQLTGSDDNSTGTNNQAVMRKVVALL